MDLENIVNSAIKEMNDNGSIREIVKKKVQSAVTDMINGILSSYSETMKPLKAALKSSLQINIAELNINQYNHFILSSVKHAIDTVLINDGANKIKAAVEEMLSHNIPKSIKLSELVKNVRELSFQPEEPNEISFHYDDDDYRGSLVWVYIDEKRNKSKYECDHKLMIRKETGEICLVETENFKISKDYRVVGKLYGFSQFLFALYAAGSTIVLDPDDVETEWDGDGSDDD